MQERGLQQLQEAASLPRYGCQTLIGLEDRRSRSLPSSSMCASQVRHLCCLASAIASRHERRYFQGSVLYSACC